MNPEKQRIAIAEACGWRKLYVCINSHAGCLMQWWRHLDNPDTDTTSLPDYLNDLNAMHEAEEAINPFLRNDYLATLWKVTGNEQHSANFWTEYNFRGFYACAHSTAAQRAEAFLRTIGKGEE